MKGKITKKSIDALIAEAKAAGGVVTSSSPMAMRTFFISRSITHASLRTAFSAAFSRSFSDTALYWHLPQRSGRRKGRGGSKNKATAGWFPQQQRGLVTGAINASTNIGAVLAAALVPLIVAQNGDHWQFVFMMTSAFSALWLIIWLKVYIKPEHNPRFSPSELRSIQAGSPPETDKKLPWRLVLSCRETWAFSVLKLTRCGLVVLFWGGIFLADKFNLNIVSMGLPLMTIYLAADIGSIAGGWLSGHPLTRGWSVNRARKARHAAAKPDHLDRKAFCGHCLVALGPPDTKPGR